MLQDVATTNTVLSANNLLWNVVGKRLALKDTGHLGALMSLLTNSFLEAPTKKGENNQNPHTPHELKEIQP
jgi:hypothetical protein